MADAVGPSVLANLARRRLAQQKAAAQLGLTPTASIPPQAGGQIRGAAPPPKVPKTPTPEEDLLAMTKEWLSGLFGGTS